MNDDELLRLYRTESSEEAFEGIVNRHINLVYSAAQRQVRDPHTAQDITQTVFVLLARKVGSLKQGTILSGWLYRTTRFVASEAIRTSQRRHQREQTALETLDETEDPSAWEELAPELDHAMAELPDKDRNLLLLRFFENKSLTAAGEALGISENAAQKRITRAIEKLRHHLSRRGANVSPATLAGLLAAFATHQAPAGLAAATLAAATAPTALLTTSILATTTLELITMTKIKIAAAGTLALTLLTTPLVLQHRGMDTLRDENQTLREQVQQLRTAQSEEAAAPGTDIAELERLRRLADEVHSLRGMVVSLRQQNRELADSTKGLDQEPAEDDLDPAIATDPMARRNLGRELAAQGGNTEALTHFLWCFDEGLKHSPAFAARRVTK